MAMATATSGKVAIRGERRRGSITPATTYRSPVELHDAMWSSPVPGQDTQYTTPSWPTSVCVHSMVGVCHSFTVLSYDAVASVFASDGRYWTSKMVSVCPGEPWNCVCRFPMWNTATEPSPNAHSACCEPGTKVMEWKPQFPTRTRSCGCFCDTFQT